MPTARGSSAVSGKSEAEGYVNKRQFLTVLINDVIIFQEEILTLEEPSASNIRSETPEGAAALPILKSPQVTR